MHASREQRQFGRIWIRPITHMLYLAFMLSLTFFLSTFPLSLRYPLWFLLLLFLPWFNYSLFIHSLLPSELTITFFFSAFFYPYHLLPTYNMNTIPNQEDVYSYLSYFLTIFLSFLPGSAQPFYVRAVVAREKKKKMVTRFAFYHALSLSPYTFSFFLQGISDCACQALGRIYISGACVIV